MYLVASANTSMNQSESCLKHLKREMSLQDGQILIFWPITSYVHYKFTVDSSDSSKSSGLQLISCLLHVCISGINLHIVHGTDPILIIKRSNCDVIMYLGWSILRWPRNGSATYRDDYEHTMRGERSLSPQWEPGYIYCQALTRPTTYRQLQSVYTIRGPILTGITAVYVHTVWKTG